ncbi:hypothetical protein F4553_007326 [Allocatelliglobosispora scoriae]|uniref:Uncharacterized protein n=1 Tax=Allocatelliglobosispora scoriae TaxID=643052 RepID=A0A841C4B1_9ACTN|nr:hypothetical protein [Allocatelliglobosispora scoriae]MBB5873892.1 hypothetical protein [Allocatelliglobosispora scoriae]
MQPSLSARMRSQQLIARTAAGVSAGLPLLGQPARAAAAPPPVPLALPAHWRPVPGAEIITASQRFTAYVPAAGQEIHLHTVYGLGFGTAHRRIAWVTLGTQRVAVYAGDTEGTFEARWGTDLAQHRLAATATTLARFMELLLGLDWE